MRRPYRVKVPKEFLVYLKILMREVNRHNDNDIFEARFIRYVSNFLRICMYTRTHYKVHNSLYRFLKTGKGFRWTTISIRLKPEEYEQLKIYACAWKLPIWKALLELVTKPFTFQDLPKQYRKGQEVDNFLKLPEDGHTPSDLLSHPPSQFYFSSFNIFYSVNEYIQLKEEFYQRFGRNYWLAKVNKSFGLLKKWIKSQNFSYEHAKNNKIRKKFPFRFYRDGFSLFVKLWLLKSFGVRYRFPELTAMPWHSVF